MFLVQISTGKAYRTFRKCRTHGHALAVLRKTVRPGSVANTRVKSPDGVLWVMDFAGNAHRKG